MLKQGVYTIILILLLSSCSKQSSIHENLVEIDSLIVVDSIDKAWDDINNIEANNMSNDGDVAYHHLLLTYLQFRKGLATSDLTIDKSIDYYKDKGDKAKLALAYVYKSFGHNQTKEVLYLLKKAEEAASDCDDSYVKEKVNYVLCYNNINTQNYQLAIKYAEQERNLATQYSNKEWESKAYQKFLMIYFMVNNPDSISYYSNKCIEAEKYLTINNMKAAALTNVGLIIINTDPEKAKNVLEKSIKIEPLANAYYGLANYYYSYKHDVQKYDSLISLSMKTADLVDKVSISELSAIVMYQNGKFKEAYEKLDEHIHLQDSLDKQVHYEQAFDVQASFDKEVQDRKMAQTFFLFAGFSALLIIIIVISVIYLRYRNANIQKDLYRNMLLRSTLEQKLHELESEGKDADKEVDTLKKKITEIQSKQSTMLSNGNKRYNEIFEENGNTLKWDKKDFDDFIEFYRMKDIVFVNALETEYSSLSNKNKVFEIVRHVANDDTVLERVFGISAVSVRSAKSRIRAKRIVQDS